MDNAETVKQFQPGEVVTLLNKTTKTPETVFAVIMEPHVLPDAEEEVVLFYTGNRIWFGLAAPYSSDQILFWPKSTSKPFVVKLDDCRLAQFCDKPAPGLMNELPDATAIIAKPRPLKTRKTRQRANANESLVNC